MIKKIKNKVGTTGGAGIFHDTRDDVRILAEVCNRLIDKVNELTDEVNKLDRENQEG